MEPREETSDTAKKFGSARIEAAPAARVRAGVAAGGVEAAAVVLAGEGAAVVSANVTFGRGGPRDASRAACAIRP